MRAHEKKKAARRAWRKHVMDGKINQADGSWQSPKNQDAMVQHMRAGYRVSR